MCTLQEVNSIRHTCRKILIIEYNRMLTYLVYQEIDLWKPIGDCGKQVSFSELGSVWQGCKVCYFYRSIRLAYLIFGQLFSQRLKKIKVSVKKRHLESIKTKLFSDKSNKGRMVFTIK